MKVYSVIYKNPLKHGKDLTDFGIWLSRFWAVQKTWGAETVRFWSGEEDEDGVVFCEYRVKDIRRWNRQAIRYAASPFIRDLETIVEPRRLTVSRIPESVDPEMPN
jgi:hypothetical protein